MCVCAYGSDPNNLATYETILNLITYLKRYGNINFEYVNYVLPGYNEVCQKYKKWVFCSENYWKRI